MSSESKTIRFLDSGREPKCKPNPEFPHGVYFDASLGMAKTCEVKLPYPAPRCGSYVVNCEDCGNSFAITVAGRKDDPHTLKLGCHAHVMLYQECR